MSNLTILIPAAGRSSRMRGRDKLLELVGGLPLLRRQAEMALQISPAVIVTLPPENSARQAVLDDLPLQCLIVPDCAEGMAASLRAGVSAVQMLTGNATSSALMILPADMPELDAADLAAMAKAHRNAPRAILRGATPGGIAGHPVIFPPQFYPELAALTGDTGARSVLVRHKARVQNIILPDSHALTDLDTPEEWADWRGGQAN